MKLRYWLLVGVVVLAASWLGVRLSTPMLGHYFPSVVCTGVLTDAAQGVTPGVCIGTVHRLSTCEEVIWRSCTVVFEPELAPMHVRCGLRLRGCW